MRAGRAAKGLSQQEFAARLGIATNTVYRIETRKGSFSLHTAAMIARYLDLPIDTLLRP